MARARSQEEEDELLARRLQLEEVMGGRARRGGAPSMAPAQPRQQTVQVQCPQCEAQNQFTVPYTSDPITVRCGSCSDQFQVQMPPPQRMDIRLCRRCGNMNQYPLPELGQPFPNVGCGVCGHISQRRGAVHERDRRQAELIEATGGGGPMVMVSIGGRRRAVPLVFLMALMSQEGHSNAAANADIDALPLLTVDEGAKFGEHTSCAICMEDFKEGDELKTLPCLHMYHGHCIDSWLQRDNSCPICKTPIGRPPSQS